MPEKEGRKPEITFRRGNCGRLWAYKDGKPSGPIYTMGDAIFEKERRRNWIDRNKPEDIRMDHNGFREFINRYEWTFAKTYAAFCPHEYLVMRKTSGKDWPLFREIAQFIRDEGFVAEYGRLGPNWYYIVDEYYYWTLDKNVEDTDLINRAKLSDFEFVDADDRKIVRRRKEG